MEITPCVGIGDLLIYKMIDMNKSLNLKKINISKQLANTYRKYPDRFICFITKLINCLFPNVNVSVVDEQYKPILYEGHKFQINSPYIFDNMNIPRNIIRYSNYIIFHTKVRMQNMESMVHFNNNELSLLKHFVENFITNKTIMILGERNIENCLEQQIHGIISIYELLRQLSIHNDVIDLTKDVLYSGNPSFDDFVDDVNMIHNASSNIEIGIGGSLAICQAVSKNNICYIGKDGYPEYEFVYKKYNGIYRDINKFITALEKI